MRILRYTGVEQPDGSVHFLKQMNALHDMGFTPITFNDYRLCQLGELVSPRKPVIITFDDVSQRTLEAIIDILADLGMHAVFFVAKRGAPSPLTPEQNVAEVSRGQLSDAQILQLHEAGHEIGSMAGSHQRLTELPQASAWDEIYHSRINLEIRINAPVRSFAYPYGSLNGDLKRMVREAGYDIACAVDSGPPRFGEDSFEIRRLTVPAEMGLGGLVWRLQGPCPRLRWMAGKLRSVFKGGAL